MSAKLMTQVALGLLLSTACAGPREPIAVGVKDIATDVLYGAEAQLVTVPEAAPLPLAGPLVAIQQPRRQAQGPLHQPAVSPTTTAPPTTTTAAPACPSASPLAAVHHEIRNRVNGPPTPASYGFRNTGSVQYSGAITFKGSYTDVASTRTVTNVRALTANEFTFDVSSVMGSASPVVTTYHVVKTGALPLDEGVFVSKVMTTGAGGTVTQTWKPELKILQFPAVQGAEWDVLSVDQASGTVQQYHAAITQNARVDACGVPLAAWRVDITGKTVGPDQRLDMATTYWISPQYGALTVMDAVNATGTVQTPQGLVNIATTNTATINSEPVPTG